MWNAYWPYDPVPLTPQLKPYAVELPPGFKGFWCSCGRSATQPWCDGKHKGSGFRPMHVENSYARGVNWALLCGCKYSFMAPRCAGNHLAIQLNKHTPQMFALTFGLATVSGYTLALFFHP